VFEISTSPPTENVGLWISFGPTLFCTQGLCASPQIWTLNDSQGFVNLFRPLANIGSFGTAVISSKLRPWSGVVLHNLAGLLSTASVDRMRIRSSCGRWQLMFSTTFGVAHLHLCCVRVIVLRARLCYLPKVVATSLGCHLRYFHGVADPLRKLPCCIGAQLQHYGFRWQHNRSVELNCLCKRRLMGMFFD